MGACGPSEIGGAPPTKSTTDAAGSICGRLPLATPPNTASGVCPRSPAADTTVAACRSSPLDLPLPHGCLPELPTHCYHAPVTNTTAVTCGQSLCPSSLQACGVHVLFEIQVMTTRVKKFLRNRVFFIRKC